MMRKFLSVAALAIGVTAVASMAGIPEPDVVLYGRVFVNKMVQQTADNITVVARVDRPPLGNFPGEEDIPVGLHHLGDVTAAAGQCAGADCYVLRIKLESLADGQPQSADAAIVGDTVRLCVSKGGNPEVCDLADSYTIDDRGTVLPQDVGIAPMKGDWNDDTLVNLTDHPNFATCMQGPTQSATAQCQAVFDFDNDSHVDLDDFASFEKVFAEK